jgi:dihydroorotate dehydrogenase (fumarate)
MGKLNTKYLGLDLKNPFVVSASPFSEKVEKVVELENAGVSAVVMYSLFEEQITHESLTLDHHLNAGTESFAEALSYFPQMGRYRLSAETYLEQIQNLKEAVDIPIIASLNGSSSGKWIEYAERMEASGADALELNLYYLPTDTDQTSIALESIYLELVRNVCMAVEIPVAVKLSPFFTSLPNFAKQLAGAGADGLVLFNRFYQPDFDIEDLEVTTDLVLSSREEMRLPLRWISILYGRVNLDFALTSGVQTAEDTLKAMMAGAKVVMVASELLRKGARRAAEILESMEVWMDEHEYDSVEQMQGSLSMRSVADPSAFERANYMKILGSFTELP